MEANGPRIILLFAAVVAVVSVLFYVLTSSGGGEAATEEPDAGAAPERTEEGQRTETLELLKSFDISDPRKLVGFSDNVFVGVVEEKAGEEPVQTTIPEKAYPQTQLTIRVEESIKSGGEEALSKGDRATVNQIGGRDPKTGKNYVAVSVFNDKHWTDQPLSVGERYLFATTYEEPLGWHFLSGAPLSNVPLSSEEGEARVELYRRAAEDPVDPMASREKTGGAKAGGK